MWFDENQNLGPNLLWNPYVSVHPWHVGTHMNYREALMIGIMDQQAPRHCFERNWVVENALSQLREKAIRMIQQELTEEKCDSLRFVLFALCGFGYL
jgi:hypothetical protein